MGEWTVPTLALLLVAYAAVSLRLRSTPLSQAIVFTLAGLFVGNRVLELVEVDVASQLVRHLAEATLALMLFTDAARINPGGLRRGARVPARLLGAGLPLTIAAGTVTALVLFPDLDIWTAAALATILAPTDAALGQPVVSNERLPSTIRQGLNVESGLNDGICVPLLIIVLTMAQAEDSTNDLDPLLVILEEIGFGALAGAGAGLLGGWVLHSCAPRGWMSRTWQQINAIAVPLLAYSVAVALGGSGFIAAFVAGIAYTAVELHRSETSTALAEQSGEMFNALTFLLFGAVLLGPALGDLSWSVIGYALLSLTVVRLVPVALAMLGTGLHPATVGFLGWFGPRGLASIVFILVLVEQSNLDETPLLLTVVTTTVALSVVLHGVTALPGANRYADWFRAHGEPSMPEAAPVALSRPRPDPRLGHSPPEDG